MTERKSLRSRSLPPNKVPITEVEYNAGFHAYMERPTIDSVRRATGLHRDICSTLIETGFPQFEYMSYADRMAKIRRAARQIEDYNISKAMAENTQLVRGLKIKLRQAFGPKFENISFCQKSLKDMKPKQMKELADFMDKMFRLEAYAMNEGADKTIHQVTQGTSGDASEIDAKLSMFVMQMQKAAQPFHELKEEPQAPEDVIDAEVVEKSVKELNEGIAAELGDADEQ